MTLAPLDSNQRTYDVFMGGDQVSYQSAFNYLFKLSLNLNEITLARFLYKALYQKELDADVLNHLKTLGIDTLKVEAHLWAWVVHITLCREQVVPGTWIRVMRLLEFATQQQDGHCSLLDVEDDEHKMRRLRLVQILDPQSAVFAALSRQDTERGKLLSSLPKLKQEYDAFTEKMLHCTCEVSGDPVLRAARSPQPKKEVKCSEFTLQLSAQLKNDPRYLAERDLIPRQEFESIKRYGVDNIDQIRMLPDGHAKKQRMQEALEETQAHLESIMQDYLSYKDLRGKEIKEKTLNKNENYQLLKHAKNIAMDQEKKINKGIALLNVDFQNAFNEAKKAHPYLQRSDFPQLQMVQVIAVQDTRPAAKTPLLEIKIPREKNFAETLSAAGKSILYVEGGLQLTYRIVMEGSDSFDFRVMGKKSLKDTNDQKWRIGTKNSKTIQTKLEITGLYIGNQAPTYNEIYQNIAPLFQNGSQQTLPDKEMAKFILDFMDKGIFPEAVLSHLSLPRDRVNAIKRALIQWLLLQTISEEQRTTGTYAEVKRVLQEYATVEDIHHSLLVSVPIKDHPQERKAPRLLDRFNPEKKMFTFMLSGGASLHRNVFPSPSQYFSNILSPESAIQALKQSRQIFENRQTSPIKLPPQPKITENQVASVKKALNMEQLIAHQDNIKALIDTVQPQIAGKRMYASTLSESTSQTDTNEPAAKKKMTIITAAACASSAHTMRIKREACQVHFESQIVEVDSELFEKNKHALQFLQKQGKDLHTVYEITSGKFTRRSTSSNEERENEMAQSGLNAMYTIQALMDMDKQDPSPATQPIVKLHTYLGWAQAAQGTAQDADNLIALIQKINNPGLEEEASLFSQALGKLGMALQLGSLGLDIAEIATAKTDDQRVQAGMGLFFDSAGLLVNGAALIAQAAGVEGAVAGAGVLGVPLAGLGIGIGALASQYQRIRDNVQQVGHQFDLYKTAYKKGYQLKDKTLFFPEGEVVTTIDLAAGKIKRSSQYIYSTTRPVAWEYLPGGQRNHDYIPWGGDFPLIKSNRGDAINLREAWGLPEERDISQYRAINQLVLPITPRTYLTPKHNQCPGAITSLYGPGFDALRELEKKSSYFAFDFYCPPGENAIQHMTAEYDATSVDIILHAQIKEIFVPKIPDVLEEKMHYQLAGESGSEYILRLNTGVSFRLRDATGTKWVFDASSLTDDTVVFQQACFWIGEIQIRGLTLSSHVIVIKKDNHIVRLDIQAQSLIDLQINEQTWPTHNGPLIQKLHALNQEHKLDAFVILDHHKENDEDVGRAFYDTARNRILYINDHDPGFSKLNIEMVVARENDFYIQDISHNTIACVNATDGYILQRYQSIPLGQQALVRTYTRGNLIFSEWKIAEGTLGKRESRTYYLDNMRPILSQVSSDGLIQKLIRLDQLTPAIRDRLNQFSLSHEQNQWADLIEVSGEKKAHQISICRVWIDKHSGNIIKLNLPPTLTNDIPMSSAFCQQHEQEKTISLLAMQRAQHGQPSIFYLGMYPAAPNQLTRDIYIQQGAEPAQRIELPKDSHVRVFGNKLFASYNNGKKQGISIDGLSSVLEKVHPFPSQKAVVVQIENYRSAHQKVVIPSIPGYETLIIDGGQGQTYPIDQMLWDNYATIYIKGSPAHIQIDIHENDWLEIKKIGKKYFIFDKVKNKTLILTTTNQLAPLSGTTIQIGQRTPWEC